MHRIGKTVFSDRNTPCINFCFCSILNPVGCNYTEESIIGNRVLFTGDSFRRMLIQIFIVEYIILYYETNILLR